MLIAPTEPEALRKIGRVSMFPERHGCDVSFVGKDGKLVGVQRKELADLFSSVEDGRLGQQVNMMGGLDAAYIIIEGVPRFTFDGDLVGKQYGQRWTRNSYEAVLWSVAARGVRVNHTRDLADTIRMLKHLEEWHLKAKHSSLDRRPGPKTMWGSAPTLREFGVHMLQSVPGLGPELAGRIFDRFGLPLELTVTVKELCEVEGVGKKTAEKIVRAFTITNPTEFVK